MLIYFHQAWYCNSNAFYLFFCQHRWGKVPQPVERYNRFVALIGSVRD